MNGEHFTAAGKEGMKRLKNVSRVTWMVNGSARTVAVDVEL